MYTMIVADDEKIVLDGIADNIAWNEYGVKVVAKAVNGKELYQLASERKPDIVLTDIRMPYMDGLEVINQLKKELTETKFIVITAFEEFEYAKKAINYGAVGFLTKPILKKELILQVEKVVDQISKEQSTNDELLRMRVSINKEQKETKQHPEEANTPIDRAIVYISENLQKGVTLVEVAEYMNMNASYFSRYFKEEYGKSFIDYVKEQKVNYAKELIRTTNLKVYEISEQLGYTSVQYFSLLFKNTTGMTPQEYKNSIEKKHCCN